MTITEQERASAPDAPCTSRWVPASQVREGDVILATEPSGYRAFWPVVGVDWGSTEQFSDRVTFTFSGSGGLREHADRWHVIPRLWCWTTREHTQVLVARAGADLARLFREHFLEAGIRTDEHGHVIGVPLETLARIAVGVVQR